jgi:phosphatidate cytidylyltransferase
LRLRVVSALALAPLPVAAIWFGGASLALLTGIAGAVMAWEWGRLCRGVLAQRLASGSTEIALVGVVIVTVAVAAVGAAGAAIALAFLGAGLVFWTASQRSGGEPAWTALGALWVALPCISLLWLALGESGGKTTLLWVLAVVWATDIGAYVVGRALGGPRLAPRISPRKTWAGLIGAVVSAAVAAFIAARLTGAPGGLLIATSMGLAIVAQLGDLAESLAKRHFGVKDSSGLIPGHGGLLDRLDGLIAAAMAAAALTLAAGNVPLAWG